MTKKILVLLLAGFLTISSMSYYVVAEASATTPKELSGNITFWHSFTQGPRLEVIQKAADDFMKEYPRTNITIETFSWSDFYTKWTTGLASGNVPDISSALPTQVVEMIDVDALSPLNDVIDKIGRDKFSDMAMTEMTKDGNIYAAPLYATVLAMWYRTDLLAKYDLEVPETWDELYEAAVKIQEGEGGSVYGASVPMGVNDMMATRWLNFYVRSAGETLITPEGKANLTSQAAIDGIKYWVKMYKDVSPADSINFNVLDQATLYYQGRQAFDFNTGFHIGGVEANSPELLDFIDCAPIPRINKDDPVVGIETNNTPIVLWKNSKNPDVAKAFIEYFFESERYVDFVLAVPVGMSPTIKGVSENERLLKDDTIKKFANVKEVLDNLLSEGTAIGMEYGPIPQAGLITSQGIIEGMFQEIILRNTPVEEAAKAAERRLNDLFDSVG